MRYGGFVKYCCSDPSRFQVSLNRRENSLTTCQCCVFVFPLLLQDAKRVDKASLKYSEDPVGGTVGRKSASKDKREDGVTRRVMRKRREGTRRRVCQAQGVPMSWKRSTEPD